MVDMPLRLDMISYKDKVMAKERMMFYIDEAVLAELRQLSAELQVKVARAGGKRSGADSMSQIVETAIKTELKRRKKSGG